MPRLIMCPLIRTTLALLCVLFLPFANSVAWAQSFPQSSPQQAPPTVPPPQLLGPDQLNNLVAPIALYPDPLLSQVLAASTYPLEVVEAQQWLQQNGNLQGRALIDAARQQGWDPSVEALVAFPEAMALFSRDIRWTTDLGNAFLDQQAGVINAIQRLRAQASNNGRLTSTPQQIVTTETQNQQSAIQIQPANPQVIYPPVYNPAAVWGPPVSGAYPALSYPQGDYGNGFGNGINLLSVFSGISGLLNWGGWGWVLNWFTHTLSLNSLFFNGFGSPNFGGFNSPRGFGGPAIWAHNPAHRLGVPYSNGFVAARYRGADYGARYSARYSSARFSAPSPAAGRFDARGSGFAPSSSSAPRGFPPGNRMVEASNRLATQPYRPDSSFRGAASPARSSTQVARFEEPQRSSQRFSSRTSSAPRHYSAPRTPHSSAPHGSSHSSGSHHSGGGHSGKGSHKH